MEAVRLLDDVEYDQRVVLSGMSWAAFEAMLALRGDASGVRMYFLDGAIELMSPSKIHEGRKKTLARLLEQWALELDVDLNGFGSWTLKKEMKEAGAEPGECYVLGSAAAKDVPDLVIEIEWSRVMGLPKREIYGRLGVRELWTLTAAGRIVISAQDRGRWAEVAKSKVLPRLDLAFLLRYLDVEPQSKAVRAMRDALRRKREG